MAGRNVVELIQWEKIPAAESRISILEEKGFIKARRAKNDASRKLYSQAYKLPNGSMLYEHQQGLEENANLTPHDQLITRYGDHPDLAEINIHVAKEDVVKKENPEGDLYYAVKESDKKKCFIFFEYSKDSILLPGAKNAQYQAITGSSCAAPRSSEAKNLEGEMLDVLARVRFDDGEYTREQLLNVALSKLEKKEEERRKIEEKDNKGPDIDVDDSLTTDNNVVIVAGKVSDDSEIDMVVVDDNWAPLDEKGSFSIPVTIPPGKDQLATVAIDQYGNRSERQIAIKWKDGAGKEKPAPMPYGNFVAVLIGNNDYWHWRDLETPKYDIQAVSEVLKGKYGFSRSEFIEDATQDEIVKAFDKLRSQLDDNDNLLIYFSGHGVLYKGNGYWVPVDGALDDPEKWIPNSEISRAIRRLPARHVVVVADSCYSGTLAAEGDLAISTKAEYQNRSRTAMSAGGGDQVVLEPVLEPGEKDYSVFAKKFIKVLQGNPTKIIQGDKLYQEVKSLFVMYPQNPQYGAVAMSGHKLGGDFFFVKPFDN